AKNLVKRRYYEPPWEKKTGAVIACEQKTFYGIRGVNKRRCVQTNIDPKGSRQLVVRTALVEQELGLNEQVLAYHREVIEDIHVLELKSRRRGI
ncbi:hypothetical protein CWB68_20800, partial [Pseudoalteromonas sp. S979]|uniref:DUF3418 domain-containing protein n=1 Tax=Pseudoalteromonas sp. S979 TaxID=579570 RepID=UPI00110C86A8